VWYRHRKGSAQAGISVLRFTLLLLFGISLSIDGKAQRPPDIKQFRKLVIEDVRIEGNKAINSLELFPILATRTSSWVDHALNWVSSKIGLPKQYVTAENLAHDTESIFISYQNIGYLDAKVSYRLIEDSVTARHWQEIAEVNKFLPPQQWKTFPDIKTTVIFTVTENKQSTVGGFTFEGLETLPDDLLAQTTEKIGIKINSPYKRADIVKEYQRVQTLLEENGYPFLARDSVIVERDEGTTRVYITVYFNVGLRYKIRDVQILYDTTTGVTSTLSESVVRRQLRFLRQGYQSVIYMDSGFLILSGSSWILHRPPS
jgi:outer membrane protein assembly factor BamA